MKITMAVDEMSVFVMTFLGCHLSPASNLPRDSHWRVVVLQESSRFIWWQIRTAETPNFELYWVLSLLTVQEAMIGLPWPLYKPT